jgi:nucleoid DNA-binding protein
MKYRIKKETKPTLKTFGKYKAVAVHNQTIESRQLFEEAARHMTISGGVLEGMMMTVAETVRRHLQMGDKVRLRDFGLMKLEIESDKVDDPKTFRANKHIRGVRLHFIPESYEGSQPLYDGITYEKDKTFPLDE